MAETPPPKNAAVMYLGSLTNKSSEWSARRALNKMAEMLGYPDLMAVDWSQLRFHDLAILREKLIEIYKPQTVNRFIMTLRGVLKYAYLLGQMAEEDYQHTVQQKYVEVRPKSSGRELSQDEIAAILTACDTGTQVGRRDAAVIALMYAAGLRPTELVGLNLSDYKDKKLIIRGKYNMQRTLYIEGGALKALQDWLSVRGKISGPLFPAFTSSNSFHLGRKMTSQALSLMLTTRAESAGIGQISPNDLRQSFIFHLLNKEVDIVTVAELAGIKDIRTIASYIQSREEKKRKAAKLLKVPYKKRT